MFLMGNVKMNSALFEGQKIDSFKIKGLGKKRDTHGCPVALKLALNCDQMILSEAKNLKIDQIVTKQACLF